MNHLDLIAGFIPAPRFTTAVVEADKLAAELGLPALTKIAVSTDWVRKAVSQSSPPPRRALGSMANHFTSTIEGASGSALKKREAAIEALEQKLSALTPELREALRSAVAKHPELKEKKAAVKIAVPLSAFLPAAKKVTSIGKTTMRGVPGTVPNLNEFKSVLKPKPAITNARQALASDHPRAGISIAQARPSSGKVISRGVGVVA